MPPFNFLETISNVITGVAGITADANSLVNYARTAAQQHLLSYNEDIPVELLTQRLCDLKQGYTQYGGLTFLLFIIILVLIVVNGQVFDRSVYRSFMLDMTHTINSNYTIPIHLAIIQDGKRRLSVPTMGQRKVC